MSREGPELTSGPDGHRSIRRAAPKRTGPKSSEGPELISGPEGHRSIRRAAPKRTGPKSNGYPPRTSGAMVRGTMGPASIDDTFDRIASVYSALGFPPDLVAHWSLPRPDAARLIAELTTARPANILEVGTFVGFSTLLMATYAPPDATIHSVDPNFPLNVELDAMNTRTADADVSLRPQEVARRAAERLGLARGLTFHAGGFAVGATFSSMKSQPTETAAVIGPEVCERYGPFDLVFIDGLHYSHAVLSDLRLAGRHLAPDGRIVLHDLIGMWGSNVRRAVYQFLLERPDLVLRHGKYAAIYDAIGVIERRDARPSVDSADAVCWRRAPTRCRRASARFHRAACSRVPSSSPTWPRSSSTSATRAPSSTSGTTGAGSWPSSAPSGSRTRARSARTPRRAERGSTSIRSTSRAHASISASRSVPATISIRDGARTCSTPASAPPTRCCGQGVRPVRPARPGRRRSRWRGGPSASSAISTSSTTPCAATSSRCASPSPSRRPTRWDRPSSTICN